MFRTKNKRSRKIAIWKFGIGRILKKPKVLTASKGRHCQYLRLFFQIFPWLIILESTWLKNPRSVLNFLFSYFEEHQPIFDSAKLLFAGILPLKSLCLNKIKLWNLLKKASAKEENQYRVACLVDVNF